MTKKIVWADTTQGSRRLAEATLREIKRTHPDYEMIFPIGNNDGVTRIASEGQNICLVVAGKMGVPGIPASTPQQIINAANAAHIKTVAFTNKTGADHNLAATAHTLAEQLKDVLGITNVKTGG